MMYPKSYSESVMAFQLAEPREAATGSLLSEIELYPTPQDPQPMLLTNVQRI